MVIGWFVPTCVIRCRYGRQILSVRCFLLSEAKSAYITVTPEMYVQYDGMETPAAALKVYNIVNGGYYSPDGNNICLTEGTYAIKYTIEGDKVEVQKLEYYIVGTFKDADGNAVNFAVKLGVTPAMIVAGPRQGHHVLYQQPRRQRYRRSGDI